VSATPTKAHRGCSTLDRQQGGVTTLCAFVGVADTPLGVVNHPSGHSFSFFPKKNNK
jgi:hypothetical protein